MTPRQRASLLILSALVLLFILAAGLSGLDLKPGRDFDIRDAAQNSGLKPASSNSDLWAAFVRGFLTLIVILIPVYIIYMLIDPQRRKRLLAELIGYGFFLFAFFMLQNYLSSLTPAEEEILPTPAVEAGLAQNNGQDGEPLIFDAEPSELAVSLIAISIGVLVVGVAGLIWWLFIRKLDTEPYVLKKVAAEAEETLESLLTGKDLRETILLCYRRMTEVAVKNRGIPREASVTPHEFEQILIEKGLPAASVRDLTHLFEDVRYGDIRADEPERRRATLALRTVIAACRKQEEPAV